MKYLISALLVFAFLESKAQDTLQWNHPSDSLRLNYMGGLKALDKEIFFIVARNNPMANASKNDKNQKNGYFTAVFTVDKDGKVGDKITIFSIGDSTTIPTIFNAIRTTSTKWINKSGKNIQVSFPINLEFEENSNTALTMPIKVSSYTGEEILPDVSFKPMNIKIFPAVSKNN